MKRGCLPPNAESTKRQESGQDERATLQKILTDPPDGINIVVIDESTLAQQTTAGVEPEPMVNSAPALLRLAATQLKLKQRVESAIANNETIPDYIWTMYKDPWAGFGTEVTPEELVAQHESGASTSAKT